MKGDVRSGSEGDSFVTINCVDVLIDGPSTPLNEPLPPTLLEYLKKERAKIYGDSLPPLPPQAGEINLP